MSRTLVLLAALALVPFLPGRAMAHDLKATVKVLPDAIVVEVGFDDDTPAEGARVVVADSSGNEVASGKTDDKGVFRIAKPGPGKYVAKAESIGHRDVVEFEIVGPATMLDSPVEYVRERPDRSLGLLIGVGAIVLFSLGYWVIRHRKSCCGC